MLQSYLHFDRNKVEIASCCSKDDVKLLQATALKHHMSPGSILIPVRHSPNTRCVASQQGHAIHSAHMLVLTLRRDW